MGMRTGMYIGSDSLFSFVEGALYKHCLLDKALVCERG